MSPRRSEGGGSGGAARPARRPARKWPQDPRERLSAVSSPPFVHEIAELLRPCPACGRERLARALSPAGPCPACDRRREEDRALAADFWRAVGGSEAEFQGFSSSPALAASLRKLLRVATTHGLCRPLIMPTTVKWEITQACNLRCRHCLIAAGARREGELSLQEAFGLLDQCAAAGVKNLGLLGGEPLLRPDVYDIGEYAARRGLEFSLSTNATLVTPGVAGRLKEVGVQDVAVSIDGLEGAHDDFRGVEGSFRQALRGLDCLVKEGLQVTVSAVVYRHNLGEMEALVDLAVEHGAARFAANDLQPIGRGLSLRDQAISLDEYEALGRTLDRKRAQHGDRIKLIWIGVGNQPASDDSLRGPLLLSKCGAALTELTVAHDGTVRPCPFLPPTRENIRRRQLEEVWFDSPDLAPYQDRDLLKGRCGRCPSKYSCSGCRARAGSLVGDVLGPDPRCRRPLRPARGAGTAGAAAAAAGEDGGDEGSDRGCG